MSDSKKNITYFSRRYITNHGGGEECDKYIVDRIGEIFNVTLISENKSKPVVQAFNRNLINKIYEEIGELSFLIKNIRYFINSNYIFITGRSLSAAFMALFFGRRIIYNIHGLTNSYAYKIMAIFGVRFIFWGVSARMNSKLKIINSNKIYKDFIPASELLLNNDLILRNYDRKNSVKLLWVGRMEPIKDPFFLIDTLVELNLIYENWTIDIIGSGSIYDLINQKLKQLSGDINKKITLHGQIRNSLLDNYYIKSDILVITSLTENFSITALEALKYKLKVISVPIINYQYSILKDYINSSEDRTPKSLAELIKNSITLSTVHDFESSKLKDVYNSQIIKIINWL